MTLIVTDSSADSTATTVELRKNRPKFALETAWRKFSSVGLAGSRVGGHWNISACGFSADRNSQPGGRMKIISTSATRTRRIGE